MSNNIGLWDVVWQQGLQPELVAFCVGLNWTYIIILSTAFYGMTHTSLLDWFINLSPKKWWKPNAMWFASLITMIIFTFFHVLEQHSLTVEYITSNLRSLFFTVIFSSIFVDIPVYIVKGLSKFIDTKSKDK